MTSFLMGTSVRDGYNISGHTVVPMVSKKLALEIGVGEVANFDMLERYIRGARSDL